MSSADYSQSSDLFDSRDDAENHLESYVTDKSFNRRFYRNKVLEGAIVDDHKVEIVEYDEGWGFEAKAVDGGVLELGEDISDYIQP